MVDEETKENTNVSTIVEPTKAPIPQYIPVIPDWVKARTATCSYEGCGNTLDPNANTKNPHTDELICPAHFKKCEDCGEVGFIDDMVKHKFPDAYRDFWYCKDCFTENFSECPNCQQIIDNDEILLPNRRNTYSMKNGGCTECAIKCESCDRVVDKDNAYSANDNNYCEDCYSNYFTTCEECGETTDRDAAVYVENVGEFCSHCYNNKFTKCESCDKQIEKSDAEEINDEYYCDKCAKEKGPAQYARYTENFQDLSYTKKDKYLNLIYKLLPISVKDLRSKQPSIASGLNDLISFAGGRLLTSEIVQQYRQSLEPEDFPIEYTTWDGVQRSIKTLKRDAPTENAQLVINVIASEPMLSKLSSKQALYDLFQKINQLSDQSGHPAVDNQIGWIRVELDPAGEYILVDEIQSDHSNAGYRLKNAENDYEINKIRNSLKQKYKLDDKELNVLLSDYSSILKDFPNIASQAVSKFANQNNFKRIFWHTYDSGMKLKNNEPPKSLYDKIPKENFFLPSPNKPFGLEGDFFEKEAKRANTLYKLARKLYLKYL